MRHVLLITAAALALVSCNKGVSLTNASTEDVAKAVKESGETAQMRPGKWETKVEMLSMEMPGMEGMPAQVMEKVKAEAMKPRTISSCMTEEDVKSHGGKVFGSGDDKCKYEKYEMSGGRIDAVMVCPGGTGEVRMAMTGTFTGDSFAVEQAMDMPGPRGAMHTKARVTGKRIGDCAAGEK